jgi:hypothetical protein
VKSNAIALQERTMNLFSFVEKGFFFLYFRFFKKKIDFFKKIVGKKQEIYRKRRIIITRKQKNRNMPNSCASRKRGNHSG